MPGVLARLRPLEKSCHGRPSNGYFALDLDSRDRSDATLMDTHLSELQGAADQVAACGGYLKVVGFARSAADLAVLAEATFKASFGTETARLIHNNGLESGLMDEVQSNLPGALREVSPDGNDVMAQLTLASQFESQRSPGTLFVEIATSGISTIGPVPMDTKAFTNAVADAAGSRVPVPNLAGATVRFVSVGTTAAPWPPLPTGLVWNLRTFYSVACYRTHANCNVTTDYTPTGD